MLINIWRYSHFILAVSSSLFVLLATVTGFILAFEPIQTKLQPFGVPGAEHVPLSSVIDTIKIQYDEVLELEVDENFFVKISSISMEASLDGDFYINPKSGEKIADIPPKNTFFEFVTNLHRSLFLKTLGRIFIGITSFLLALIAITGSILVIQRQKGFVNFFRKIVKEDFYQYYHIILGRLMLIPILILSLTGVYLSLLRFEFIPNPDATVIHHTDSLLSTPLLSPEEFDVFKKTTIGDLRKLEFPFSDDVEDFFILSLKDRELKINQKTGEIVETRNYPFVNALSELNFNLHTGAGSIIWPIILAIACVNILFFMYSGGAISYRRLSTRVKNTYSAQESEIVILIGTENGSTRIFGQILQNALLKANQKVFLDDLNNYESYEKLKHLVVLTSTYGVGDPPANGGNFLQLLKDNPLSLPFDYSVVGFGSLAYPDFCQFALDVDTALAENPNARPFQKPFLIHNKSYVSFNSWVQAWQTQMQLNLAIPATLTPNTKGIKRYPFKVIDKQFVQDKFDETFVLRIKPLKKMSFQSGDLMAIWPPDDPVERLYSIGKDKNGDILLSIKRHEHGVCSNYLNTLNVEDTLDACIQQNKDFHFPRKAKSVTLIANGTGIAPFLGMIHQKRTAASLHLYWGGRTHEAFELYKGMIEHGKIDNSLNQYQIALSREETYHKYVQDLIEQDAKMLAEQLDSGGKFMICGSIGMQNGVLTLLDEISQTYNQKGLNEYMLNDQILMDCY